MKKKPKKLLKLFLPVAAALAMLGTGAYSWIYGNVTPEVNGDFKIGSMSGLNFVIDTTKTDLIDLNEAYGISTEGLNLNEVSSADGKTFFARDTARLYLESGSTAASGNQEIITFRPAEINAVVETGEEENRTRSVTGDYMDVSFQMMLDYNADDAASYYIYFLNGEFDNTVYSSAFKKGAGSTDPSAGGLKALRAALRVSGATGYGAVMREDSGAPGTYSAIFGNEAELGTAEYPYRTSAVSATETVQLKATNDASSAAAEEIAGSYTINYLTGIKTWPHSFGTLDSSVDVHSFSACAINPAELNNILSGTELPHENYLFMMDKDNHTVNVTLRVWLEGGSEACVNGTVIPDDAIDLDLYFAAYCVEAAES